MVSLVELVHAVPIATTAIAAAFAVGLAGHAASRGWPPHLAWWTAGVVSYGAGTALEGAVMLLGNGTLLNRLWYWAGAVLGAYPLATGTVYLLLPRGRAHRLTLLSGLVVVAASVAVLLTPMRADALDPAHPSGAALGWQWIRGLTPVINGYAAVFLIGGAAYSVLRNRRGSTAEPGVGTALIAGGALLPAVGGVLAKTGRVEALYVAEFLGILVIGAGYRLTRRRARPIATSEQASAHGG